MVYRYTNLTITHAFAAEDLYLLSEMRISLAVQKLMEFAYLPYIRFNKDV